MIFWPRIYEGLKKQNMLHDSRNGATIGDEIV